MSLFKKAETTPKRLKALIFGPAGVGKTITALHFPSPAMVDAERGAEFYGEEFDFVKINTKDPEIISQALDELLADPGDVKTFILDSITEVDDSLQAGHLKRLRIKNNNPNYTFQPLDYKIIKGDRKILVTKLLNLDMNIIVTSRSKPQYSEDEGDFMKKIGEMPDCPKEMPYLFDVVLELAIGADGQRIAKVVKDRSNKLPDEFPFSYESFVEYLGVEGLERAADASKQKTKVENSAGRKFDVEFDGNKVKTAGVKGEQLTEIVALTSEMNEADIRNTLVSEYSVESFLDLREDEAGMFIEELKNK